MLVNIRRLIVKSTRLLELRKFRSNSRLVKMSTSHLNGNLPKTSLIAVCQMTSTSNKENNFSVCENLVSKATAYGAQMVFLPEGFDFIGENKQQSIDYAETLTGPLISSYTKLAKEKAIWISLGGFHEKAPDCPAQSPKFYNAHILINSDGEIVEVYRKLHLFDIDIPGKVRLKESDLVLPGSKFVPPVATPVGNVGLGICYDMRFPEFCISLRKSGADIITYPSAFTQTTGMAHWEAILRTRAIESQCYVIAAAQTGAHNPKRTSYGHAMVIDPWGCILACCAEGTNLALAEINLDYVKKIRSEMPVYQHRRSDIYGQIFSAQESHGKGIESQENYQFGPVSLPSSQLFFLTRLSMAFVNNKPVVPGHVLVAPLRSVERLSDLQAEEISDMFQCIQKVQAAVEKEFNSASSTIAIQDGPDAGRTIPHLHVHVIPRKPNDFKRNDDVYLKLEDHELDQRVRVRTEEEMTAEAKSLRKYFE